MNSLTCLPILCTTGLEEIMDNKTKIVIKNNLFKNKPRTMGTDRRTDVVTVNIQ